MTITDIHGIMNNLASKGYVFSNEADFQFLFANELAIKYGASNVFLELCSFDGSKYKSILTDIKSCKKLSKIDRQYTDIIVKEDGKYYAFELKYKTCDKACLYDNTSRGDIITLAQGAYDLNAHAFYKDIERLEKINNRKFSNINTIYKSFVIFLSNYKIYWTYNFSKSSIWKEYSMEEGKKVTPGTLCFKDTSTIYKTKHATFHSVKITNTYVLHWDNYTYSGFIKQPYNEELKYLLLEI